MFGSKGIRCVTAIQDEQLIASRKSAASENIVHEEGGVSRLIRGDLPVRGDKCVYEWEIAIVIPLQEVFEDETRLR